MPPVAIYAVDPGTVSGVARGVFDTLSDGVWDGLNAGKWESWEVTGSPDVQCWEIMGEYADWHRAIEPVGARLVFEDFVVRLGTGAASRRELLDPVRVTSGCEALSWTRAGLRWVFAAYQQPSIAKNFATNERLRRHGLWVKGSDHRRDAVRHMVACYAGIIGALDENKLQR